MTLLDEIVAVVDIGTEELIEEIGSGCTDLLTRRYFQLFNELDSTKLLKEELGLMSTNFHHHRQHLEDAVDEGILYFDRL